MIDNAKNLILAQELYSEYDWYQNTFAPVLQNSGDDFFTQLFDIKFVALSKNINCLQNGEFCFVTKIKINKEYDLFLRLNDKAVSIILDRILGKSNRRFDINKISELEAKIITSFNSNIYDNLKDILVAANPKELKRSNFDIIHLTFLLKDLDETVKNSGKIFVSLPASLLAPEKIQSVKQKFSKEDFNSTEIIGKIFVGAIKTSLYDVKHLDVDDVVVFEDTNITKLKLFIKDKEMDVNINPNMDLLIPENDNLELEDENNMSETHSLWDSIEVEMNAEFDAVKITLGELKNIENGLVVDLTSLYNNNVTLKVENKPVASGTLVIVNDRYGVKINKIFEGINAGGDSEEISSAENNQNDENNDEQDFEQENNEQELEENSSEENEEDFDYSDFELEDENI